MVPELLNILKISYSHITPIYFWSRREGNKLAKADLDNKRFSLVAMYARRPKVDKADSSHICVNFNSTLFEAANILEQYNIPVIAGVPCINTITALECGVDCAWFYLSPRTTHFDATAIIDLRSNKVFVSDDNYVHHISDKSSIVNIVNKKSVPLLGQDALTVMKMVKSANYHTRFYGNIYKPVYFILI